ncbi:MAG: prepilin peptidase [Spirochaetota bacterium]
MGSSAPIVVFLIFSLPICVSDLRSMRIPNGLVGAAGIFVGTAATLTGALSVAIGGALYAAGVLAAARILSGGGLGAGDVKYGAVLGAAVGLPAAAVALPAAAVGAGLAAVLSAAGRRSRGRRRRARPWSRPGAGPGPRVRRRPGSQPGPQRGPQPGPEPGPRRRVPFAPALAGGAVVGHLFEIIGGIE